MKTVFEMVAGQVIIVLWLCLFKLAAPEQKTDWLPDFFADFARGFGANRAVSVYGIRSICLSYRRRQRIENVPFFIRADIFGIEQYKRHEGFVTINVESGNCESGEATANELIRLSEEGELDAIFFAAGAEINKCLVKVAHTVKYICNAIFRTDIRSIYI